LVTSCKVDSDDGSISMTDINNLFELPIAKRGGANPNLLDDLVDKLDFERVLAKELWVWARRLSTAEAIDGKCCIAGIGGILSPVIVRRTNARPIYQISFLRCLILSQSIDLQSLV